MGRGEEHLPLATKPRDEPHQGAPPIRGAPSSSRIWTSGAAIGRIAVLRIDLETGACTLFRELAPRDATGVNSMRGLHFTPDGKAYGYTFTVQLDDLYLMDQGL